MCARYGFNIFYLNILWMLDIYSIAKAQFLPLLSTRWASEYDDIYDDLKAEGMEELIKTPPKAKTSKKKS